jgi:SAM-dependent methyltransferase
MLGSSSQPRRSAINELRCCARTLRDRIEFIWFRLRTFASSKKVFECPICGYKGPFMDVSASTGLRKHAKCPKCGALERHRLQYLAVEKVLRGRDISKMTMLHFAPESFFRRIFAAQLGNRYHTADLEMKDVDYNVDMRELPFADGSYDFVLASNVLDYIPDDRKAISEVRRILKPNGIAILPVSVVCEETIEYSEPNPYEFYHVRASGMDYYKRYEGHFAKVETMSSDSLPDEYQLFIYEDRSVWPTKECPLRPSMPGERHINIVPVCYA